MTINDSDDVDVDADANDGPSGEEGRDDEMEGGTALSIPYNWSPSNRPAGRHLAHLLSRRDLRGWSCQSGSEVVRWPPNNKRKREKKRKKEQRKGQWKKIKKRQKGI